MKSVDSSLEERRASAAARDGGRAVVFTKRADVFGEAHFDEMAGFAAFEEAGERPFQSRRRTARRTGPVEKRRAWATDSHGEMEATLADEKRVAEEIGVDGAVPNVEVEARDENVFKLDPEEFGVEFFVWHFFVLRELWRVGVGLQAGL